MKKWGVIISLLYAVIVLFLLIPGLALLATSSLQNSEVLRDIYRMWVVWALAAIFIVSGPLLVLLTVDRTQRKLRPRTSIVTSALITGLLLALLTGAATFSLIVAALGEEKTGHTLLWATSLGIVLTPWVLWGGLFYALYRKSSDPVTHAFSWLLRGSVLELLVALPCHVIVRRRDDCCAPYITGLGISSGIAIMLLSFGPGILLLFKKRMEQSRPKHALTT